jgi:Holliday junction resolvase RusA-like endonuclease
VTSGGYTFVVPGPPTGKGRPKFNRKSGVAVTPARTRIAENRVLLAWQDANHPRYDLGPVSLHVEAVLERPRGHYRTNGLLNTAGERSGWPTKVPDADNLLKLVADALNKQAYRDDSQIVHATVIKRWANPDEGEHLRVSLAPMPVLDQPHHARAVA